MFPQDMWSQKNSNHTISQLLRALQQISISKWQQLGDNLRARLG